MKYTGAYDSNAEYAVGDIAVYTDGVAYHLTKPAPEGTSCHDVRYWSRLQPPLADAILAFHEAISNINETVSSFGESITALESVVVDDKTLALGSSEEGSEKVFAITVDDDGDITATEIEIEEGGD